MIVVLMLILLVACVTAPWLGAESGDTRSERARPAAGWYPALPTR